MHKRNWILLGFALVVAAQLAVPAGMIVDREWTLRHGQLFKFKTRPVDPADAFRGRYIWLGLEPETIQLPDASTWSANQKAFAVVETDANGFATVKRLERTCPANEAAVPVCVSWWGSAKNEVHITWPGLDRYYMAEGKAPAAEKAYREHNRRATPSSCHVTVRVRGTHAVIENLFIDNQPIQEWLRTHGLKP